MIQMSTFASWALVLTLILLVGAVVWLVIELKIGRAKRLAALAALAPYSETDSLHVKERLAPVTDLRTRRPVRHLSLVEASPRDPRELYDWQQSGI